MDFWRRDEWMTISSGLKKMIPSWDRTMIIPDSTLNLHHSAAEGNAEIPIDRNGRDPAEVLLARSETATKKREA